MAKKNLTVDTQDLTSRITRASFCEVTLTDTLVGVVQKVTFLGNTDHVNFGWFAHDSTDGHPKKCYPILNHAQIPNAVEVGFEKKAAEFRKGGNEIYS